ncbi:MAG: (2Fe-2S) ferredoxin domain-containing protein [Chloroflexaceae bacterium]
MPYRLYLCAGPHCTARGPGTHATLERALWEAGLLGAVELHLSGCQDHCDHGPNLLVQPGNYRYVGVTAERAAAIIARHLRDGLPTLDWQATPEMRRKAP